MIIKLYSSYYIYMYYIWIHIYAITTYFSNIIVYDIFRPQSSSIKSV